MLSISILNNFEDSYKLKKDKNMIKHQRHMLTRSFL